MALRLSELAKMPPSERAARLAEIADAAMAPRTGQAAGIAARIGALEAQYQMTSAEMVTKLRDGAIRDTEDVASWLMLLRLLERL